MLQRKSTCWPAPSGGDWRKLSLFKIIVGKTNKQEKVKDYWSTAQSEAFYYSQRLDGENLILRIKTLCVNSNDSPDSKERNVMLPLSFILISLSGFEIPSPFIIHELIIDSVSANHLLIMYHQSIRRLLETLREFASLQIHNNLKFRRTDWRKF